MRGAENDDVFTKCREDVVRVYSRLIEKKSSKALLPLLLKALHARLYAQYIDRVQSADVFADRLGAQLGDLAHAHDAFFCQAGKAPLLQS